MPSRNQSILRGCELAQRDVGAGLPAAYEITQDRNGKPGDGAAVHDACADPERAEIGVGFLVIRRFDAQQDEVRAFQRGREPGNIRPRERVFSRLAEERD